MTQNPIGEIQQAWQRLTRQAAQPSLEQYLQSSGVNVARTGRQVLAHLNDRGPLMVSELAALSGVDISTMSRTLKTLHDSGLIARQPGETDQRCVRISLSQAGAAMQERSLSAGQELLNSALRGWAEVDKQALAALMSRFSVDFAEALRRESPAGRAELLS